MDPTPAVFEGLEFQIYRSSQTLHHFPDCHQIEFAVKSDTTPEITRTETIRMSHLERCCLRDLDAGQILGRNTPQAYGSQLRGWIS